MYSAPAEVYTFYTYTPVSAFTPSYRLHLEALVEAEAARNPTQYADGAHSCLWYAGLSAGEIAATYRRMAETHVVWRKYYVEACRGRPRPANVGQDVAAVCVQVREYYATEWTYLETAGLVNPEMFDFCVIAGDTDHYTQVPPQGFAIMDKHGFRVSGAEQGRILYPNAETAEFFTLLYLCRDAQHVLL